MKKIITFHLLFLILFLYCTQTSSASTITYSYDNTHQLTGAAFTNCTSTVSYFYDRSGNRITYIENAPDHGTPSASVSSSIDEPAKPYMGPNNKIITGRGYGSGILKVEISTDGGRTWTATGVTDTSGNGSWATWRFTWTALPAEGKYFLMSRATSTTNEVEIPVNSLSVYVDKTAPTNRISYPTNGTILPGGTCTITGTADDGLGVGIDYVEVTIDAGAHWQRATNANDFNNSWSYDINATANQNYVIQTRAVDLAGNIEANPQKVTTGSSSGWAWGRNYDGQLGNGQWNCGGWTISSTPSRALEYKSETTSIDLEGIIQISGGDAYSLVLRADGTVWGAGKNNYGQLGLGNTDQKYTFSSPVVGINNVGILTGVKQIACGTRHVLALLENGTVVSWGWNQDGQLGLGYYADEIKSYPQVVPNLTDIVAVYAGGIGQSAAKNSLGQFYVWGGNGSGELGRPFGEGRVPSPQPSLSGFKEISFGTGSFTIGLKNDNSLWGLGTESLLTGGTANQYNPIHLDLDPNVSNEKYTCISAGNTHSVAVRDDGVVTTFGNNGFGQLGNGQHYNGFQIYRTNMGSIKKAVAGDYITAVLKNDGTVWACGLNEDGACGQGDRTCGWYDEINIPSFVQVKGPNNSDFFLNVNDIAAPDFHFIAIKKMHPYSAINLPLTNSYLTTNSYTIRGTASDDNTNIGIQGVYVSTDDGNSWSIATDKSGNGSWSSWEYNWNVLSNGTYNLLSKAIDMAGNEETPGQSVIVTKDSCPSLIGINSIIKNGINYTITGFSDDGLDSGVSQVQVSTDGGTTYHNATDTTPAEINVPWASWNYNWTPADGQYSLQAKATDRAGNVSYSSDQTIIVDNTPPISTIASPPADSELNVGTVIISGEASDSGSGVQKVEVSTDGGSTWSDATGTGPWTFSWTPIADGNYNLKSKATDNAGNQELPGSGRNIIIDRTAPASTITAPADNSAVRAGTVIISGTASDVSGSGVQRVEVGISINGGNTTWGDATGTNSWSFSWNPSAEGNYNIRSRSTDNAGNVEISGNGVTVLVDNAAPTGSISINNGSGHTHFSFVNLSATASDTGSGVSQMQVGNDPSFSSSTWTAFTPNEIWNLTPGAGIKTVYARFMDAAGNISDVYSARAKVVPIDETTDTGGSGSGVIQLPSAGCLVMETLHHFGESGLSYSSNIAYGAPTASTGSWTSSQIDLGQVLPVIISTDVVSQNLTISYEIRYKSNNEWSNWEPLTQNPVTMEFFQIRANLTSLDTSMAAQISKFEIIVFSN